MKQVFLWYLLFINIVGNIMLLIDKLNAIKNRRRISERTLLITNLIGAFTMFIGSMLFSHKTQKFKFAFVYLLSIIIYTYIIVSTYF